MAERAILCEDVENHTVVKPTPNLNANINDHGLDPERDPDPDFDHKQLIHVESSRSVFPSDTYVVQVPKDQIYRIPPPENALIAEQRRNPSPKSKKSCCHCLFFVVLVIIVVLVGITIGITSIFLKPKDPTFQVDHFLLTNSSSQSHKSSYGYKIKLEVGNPNANYGILYREGGLVSLSCKQQKIAGGFYPSLGQGKKSTTFVQLNLNESTTTLPKDLEESIKTKTSKVHVSFQLTMKIPSRMKILFASRNYDFSISCNFEVDSLVGSSRILSQQCQTKH